MKRLLFFVFIVINFINLESCANYVDDNVTPKGNNNGGGSGNNSGGNSGGGNNNSSIPNLPIKITRDYKRYETFKYDNKGRIVQQNMISDIYYLRKMFIKYSNDTIVSIKKFDEWFYNDTIYYKFIYSGNTIRYDYATSNGSVSGYNIMTLDNNCVLLKDDYRYVKREYFYDSNKNLIKIKVVNQEVNYSYFANTNGVFKNVNMPQWFFYSVFNTRVTNSIFNNMSKAIGQTNIYDTINYRYQYNKDGYPVNIYSDRLEDLEIEYSK